MVGRSEWSQSTDYQTVLKRAGGRFRYNVRRAEAAEARQDELVRLLRTYGFYWGVQGRIARELSVSEATISRDLYHMGLDVDPETGKATIYHGWRQIQIAGGPRDPEACKSDTK